MTSWWRTERVNEWDETQVLDNKGSLFFTHCGFMDIMLLPTSDQKASAPLLSVVLMMRPPYNQLYSAAAPLFSLVIAHIHQYPISFSWSRSHFISRTPNTLLLFHESNFHCNKTRFVLGSDTSGKTNIAGSLSQRLPWLQSHSLMIGFTLCYRWLHPPDSQRQCDINDSDVPPYRLQAETSKEWWRKKKKNHSFYDLDPISTLSLLRRSASATRGDTCHENTWIRAGRGKNTDGPRQEEGNGVNVSPHWPDERSPIVCCRVKAGAPFL